MEFGGAIVLDFNFNLHLWLPATRSAPAFLPTLQMQGNKYHQSEKPRSPPPLHLIRTVAISAASQAARVPSMVFIKCISHHYQFYFIVCRRSPTFPTLLRNVYISSLRQENIQFPPPYFIISWCRTFLVLHQTCCTPHPSPHLLRLICPSYFLMIF